MVKGKGKLVVKKIKKWNMKVEVEGMVYIQVFFNNIIILLINKCGQVIFWVFVGKVGFCGFKKNMFYVVQVVVVDVFCIVYDVGFCFVEVFVKGFGFGCEVVIWAIDVVGIKVICIKDVMFVLYNGCCFFKCRRV